MSRQWSLAKQTYYQSKLNPDTGTTPPDPFDIANQWVWTNVFTVARSDSNTLTWTASSNAEATLIANWMQGHLFRIDNGDWTGYYRAWITRAIPSGTTVTIELNGQAIPASWSGAWDSNLATARVSIDETIRCMDWFLDGQQVVNASNPQWTRYIYAENYDIFVLSVDVWVETAAAWSWADYGINLYDDWVAMFGSTISLGSSASSTNNIPTSPTVNRWEDVTMRVLTSAWATNVASDANINAYRAPYFIFDAI